MLHNYCCSELIKTKHNLALLEIPDVFGFSPSEICCIIMGLMLNITD